MVDIAAAVHFKNYKALLLQCTQLLKISFNPITAVTLPSFQTLRIEKNLKFMGDPNMHVYVHMIHALYPSYRILVAYK